MSDAEYDQLSDHEYDGIREYDNPTPGWWVLLFVLTVAFSVVYFLYYHVPVPDRSVYDALARSEMELVKKQASLLGEMKTDEASLLSYMNSKPHLAFGEATFKSSCVSCHGNQGQGINGFNLTDNAYKHVAKLEDIPKVIKNGANNGAMPAQLKLSERELAAVSAYVASLRGTNVAGRPPEGVEIAPWPPLRDPPPKPAATPGAK